MPKMIVSLDNVVIKEVPLTKDRTTLGRRHYNDIVIDSLAVSGEHAALLRSGLEVYIEDLNSTNGTYVAGKPIKKQLLQNGDFVEIGKYRIQLSDETSPATTPPPTPGSAVIKVRTGAAAGREMVLTKVVTTLGKPGIAVAAITNRDGNFVIVHVEGIKPTLVNSAPVGAEPVALRNGDQLELADTQMQFVQY